MEKIQLCKETEAETFMNLGMLYNEEEDFDYAIENLNKSLEIYRELENGEAEAFVLDLIGDTYLSTRETHTALKYYNDAYKAYTSIRSSLKADMLEKIREVEDIQDAMDSAKSEKDKYEEDDFPSEISAEEDYSPDFVEIGNKIDNVIKLLESARAYEIYIKAKDPMEELQEIFNTSRDIGDMKGEAISLLIMGDVSLKNEKTSAALKYFDNAYKIFDMLGDEKGEAISLVLIGTVDFVLGDMAKVSSNFRKAIELFKKLNDKSAETVTMDLLSSLNKS
ncbi:MAG: tetratricopeptide repeat protein [Methanobacterium sp.]|uniref:tetratricopeptide repeat protein n=1 Tax=Methanobacterium sp. TaxID=2164 RepID=UPI003D660B47|nr:tetratricopeptide repeat protein [Methanobacterium sp.]